MLTSLQLFEGLFNPKIKFTDAEWASLVTDHMTKGSHSEIDRMIASWAHFPKLTAAARQAWQSKSKTGTEEFKDVVKDAWELHDAQLQLLNLWRETYKRAFEDIATAESEKAASRASYLYAFNQRMFSMAVFNVCYINCLIRAMSLAEDVLALRKEAVSYGYEIITLAYDAMPYRPLGSSFIPLCLMVAWFTPADDEMRGELETLWGLYCEDFPAARDVKLENNLAASGFLGAV